MQKKNIVKRICGRLKRDICSFLRPLSKLVPNKKGLWLFGAWQGSIYADNAKYMFEYVLREHPEIKAVWMTRSSSVKKKLDDLQYPCCKPGSLKGLYYTLRAELAFETEGEWDISYLLNPRDTVIVQLWHGIGVKALNWKTGSYRQKKTVEHFKPYYWCATSELYVDVITDLMQVKSERFGMTGYPRNDTFISKPKNEAVEKNMAQHPGKRFVIYMPTHRNFGKDGNAFINVDVFEDVNKRLEQNNMILVYKPHFHELENFLPYESKYPNIIFAKEQEIWADPYSYLHYFDAMISDYSSCIFDFTCSGKPVVLFPYDLESYKTGDAGLLDIYWTIPAGPMCMTWNEVLETLNNLFRDDDWAQKREECRRAYHIFNDGKNCERVYDFAQSVLKGEFHA